MKQGYQSIDRSVFANTQAEKDIKKAIKADHRKELKRHYGSSWKRHLNIPSKQLDAPVKMTF